MAAEGGTCLPSVPFWGGDAILLHPVLAPPPGPGSVARPTTPGGAQQEPSSHFAQERPDPPHSEERRAAASGGTFATPNAGVPVGAPRCCARVPMRLCSPAHARAATNAI